MRSEEKITKPSTAQLLEEAPIQATAQLLKDEKYVESILNIFKSDKIESDKIESDKIKSDKIESDKIKSDKIESDKIKSDKIEFEENGSIFKESIAYLVELQMQDKISTESIIKKLQDIIQVLEEARIQATDQPLEHEKYVESIFNIFKSEENGSLSNKSIAYLVVLEMQDKTSIESIIKTLQDIIQVLEEAPIQATDQRLEHEKSVESILNTLGSDEIESDEIESDKIESDKIESEENGSIFKESIAYLVELQMQDKISIKSIIKKLQDIIQVLEEAPIQATDQPLEHEKYVESILNILGSDEVESEENGSLSNKYIAYLVALEMQDKTSIESIIKKLQGTIQVLKEARSQAEDQRVKDAEFIEKIQSFFRNNHNSLFKEEKNGPCVTEEITKPNTL